MEIQKMDEEMLYKTFDYDKEAFSIKEDAPEEVKKAFEELQKMK